MYFLTSIFHNKFGEGTKYYDDKGWHWMLASDKPTMFKTEEEALEFSKTLYDTVETKIQVKEIEIFENLWEHKISEDGSSSATIKEALFEKVEGKNKFFLSKKKQHPEAKILEGLYPIDKKIENWIYCVIKKEEVKANGMSLQPEHLIMDAFERLKEAKALMQILEFDKSEIAKLDGVMVFVAKIIKNNENYNPTQNVIVSDEPQHFILEAYERLQDAKVYMQKLSYDKSEIGKLEGVMVFVNKIVKR